VLEALLDAPPERLELATLAGCSFEMAAAMSFTLTKLGEVELAPTDVAGTEVALLEAAADALVWPPGVAMV
jgi:hypothetical protein